jgi:hypothetical protein
LKKTNPPGGAANFARARPDIRIGVLAIKFPIDGFENGNSIKHNDYYRTLALGSFFAQTANVR